jgi:hypothetical protein
MLKDTEEAAVNNFVKQKDFDTAGKHQEFVDEIVRLLLAWEMQLNAALKAKDFKLCAELNAKIKTFPMSFELFQQQKVTARQSKLRSQIVTMYLYAHMLQRIMF